MTTDTTNLNWSRWSPEEDAILAAMYEGHTRGEIALVLNRSEGSVRSRCWTLQLNTKLEYWSDWELLVLQSAYSAKHSTEIQLTQLAKQLGRHKTNVSRKARSLGLTDICRPCIKPEDRKIRRPKFATKEDRLAAQSLRVKQWYATHAHPRGALGMRHTDAVKAAQSAQARQMWADPTSKVNSAENRQRLSDNMTKRVLAGKMLAGPHVYSRCASGKRADLNDRYFRSSWEANYARYLNLLVAQGQIKEWDYECKTFEFEKIKRGTRCYTPDFKVTFTDGRHEWHEVKGWMDDKSRVRLERMARYYPNEVVVVIGPAWFKNASRGVAHGLPHWERGGKKAAPPASVPPAT